VILYLFSHFLSDLDSNADRLGYTYEYGLLMYRIRSEADAVTIKYGYFFGYRVKATFIHITHVVTFKHPTSPNFN
jgi:hypothetical protein